jgi:hypothetical protein
MARVIGSEAGGYATVAPTENYIGQALQNVEANAFKYREEKREQEAKAAALARAKQAALDKQRQEELDNNDKLNAIKAKDSGISGINSAVYNGMGSQREKFLEADRKYRETGDRKYLVERSAAINNLNTIANIPESYRKAIDNIHEGVTNGTIDRSELKRIQSLGDKIEKGFVVPKIENGQISFDVFERDPQTGELSKIAVNNMKGEDLINELTPHKKFDYNKHIKEVQNLAGNSTTTVKNGIETTGYPNAEKFATEKANQLLTDMNLLDDVAQLYGIEEDPKLGYSPEDKKAIYNRYYKDIVSGLNVGTKPNYEAERIALARQESARKAAKQTKEDKTKAFKPPISIVTKGGRNTSLGLDISKGNKIFGPTYEKGKDGPIKGVVLRDNGDYAFSISARKDDTLNAQGLANKNAFESNPANAGKEYKPVESDYVYSAAKPTEFTSRKDSPVIQNYIRGMLNPTTGEYFQNFEEYKSIYDRYKPKKTAAAVTKKPVAQPKKALAFDAEAYYKKYKSQKK